ncbi:MAG TPA: MIP/aquaporin family protein [Ktedonobacteraceae bacterium]|jgi:MIP family channel proteins|nr:MIP/aquaporin family protein [Ktedonobacteraceae bacterium]
MTSPIMLRRYLAEFVGTFAYVFFGCGTRILAGNAQDAASRLIVYFTFGFTLLALTYALSHLSGAPFNPAITLGLALTRRFPWRYVLPYWISQVAGAIFASALLGLFLHEKAVRAQYAATIPTIGVWEALGIETIITLFLMLVAMSSATDKRVNRGIVGIAMGFTIILCGWFASPLTGGSMNPARSLAPALLAGGQALSEVWIYWVGPLLGAVLGSLLYELMRGGEEHALEVPQGVFEGIRKTRAVTTQEANQLPETTRQSV